MLAELTVKEFLDKVAGSDPVPEAAVWLLLTVRWPRR